MKKHILTLILCVSVGVTTTYAFNSLEASFTIELKGQVVIVKAEVPKNIQNALLEFSPELQEIKDREQWDKSFFDYVNFCFKLRDKNFKELKLINIQKIASGVNQKNYIFVFQGSEVYEVENSLLFNLSESHVNRHSIVINGVKTSFETTKNASSYFID